MRRKIESIPGTGRTFSSASSPLARQASPSLAETFGRDMNLHSGGELGIATATHLAGRAAGVRDGKLRVRTGPGLAHYTAVNAREGDLTG